MSRSEAKVITAETITDEQIRELRRAGGHELSQAVASGGDRAPAMDVLLVTYNALARNSDTSDSKGTWNYWRASCAKILNARAASKDGAL